MVISWDFIEDIWGFIGIHWPLKGFDGIDGIELVVISICLDLIG